MIVVCTTCQTRFKVADEKIGPRGAKVRCSKCQTVFVVQLDLDLEAAPRAGVRPSGMPADPFAQAMARPPAAVDPFASAGRAAASRDPFASAAPSQDPFAPAAPTPAPDPFAAAASAPRRSEDPFAAGLPAGGHGPDPFASADPFAAADPFASAAPAPAHLQGGFGDVDPFAATVTAPAPASPAEEMPDLSDLLGGTPPPAGARPSAPGSQEILEEGFEFDAAAGGDADGLSMEPSSRQASAPAARAPLGAAADLALEERTAVPAASFGDFADPFADPGASSGFGAGAPGEPEPALETFEPAPSAPTAAPPQPTPRTLPASAPVVAPPAAPATAPERSSDGAPRRRGERLRLVVVNAVSLLALLAVALGFLAYWRGQRPAEEGLFHPSAVLGAIRGGPEPFGVERIRSGLYERTDAPPVLFVSGVAVSRAAGAVPGVRVRVEVLRNGAVVAQGEARAGAVPTPEELSAARDAEALATLAARASARAPAAVKPGEAVPFVVAIADYPADVMGGGLRIAVEPLAGTGAGGRAR